MKNKMKQINVEEKAEAQAFNNPIKIEDQIIPEWIPREKVMLFFDYGDTQMSSLERKGNLKVAKVGKRKFYHKKSLLDFLESSVLHY